MWISNTAPASSMFATNAPLPSATVLCRTRRQYYSNAGSRRCDAPFGRAAKSANVRLSSSISGHSSSARNLPRPDIRAGARVRFRWLRQRNDAYGRIDAFARSLCAIRRKRVFRGYENSSPALGSHSRSSACLLVLRPAAFRVGITSPGMCLHPQTVEVSEPWPMARRGDVGA